MISRRAFCVVAAAAALPPHARADNAPLLREVRQRLAVDLVVRGAFEQRKTIQGFRNPLLSSGDFVVARQRGVVWRTREPFPSTLVVTRDRVLARQADGSIGRSMNASEEPALRAISETLFGVMAAELAMLEQRFRIEGELAGREGWKLVLLPRDAMLARWVQRIDLEGDHFLRNARLQEGNSDLSLIRFSRHSTDTGLRPDEEAQFA